MPAHDDTAIVAIRNILTRLCKRSGLSQERLTTTEIDITPLLDLPVIRDYAVTHRTSTADAVLPVIRELARRLPASYRVITDAELSLGLLRETDTPGIDPAELYSQDLGDRRQYLSTHWRRLHEIADADPIPPTPTVRSLRATPERHAFTALAALMVTGNVYSDSRPLRATDRHRPTGKIGTLTVVGDAVMDHIYQVKEIPSARDTTRGLFTHHPGGKGLNCAVAAARLGIDVRFVSAVGSDDNGRKILDYLRSKNIDTSLVEVVPNTDTSITALMINPTGLAGTITCVDGQARLTGNELGAGRVRTALAESDAVLLTLEPPLPVIEQTLATLRAVPERPMILVTSASMETPQVLYPYLSSIDYLIGSTHELDVLIPEVPAQSGSHIAELLQMLGARAVCVVEDFGCTVRSDHIALDIPRFQGAALTDAPGSRSAFTGALIYRMLSKHRAAAASLGPDRNADEQDFTWATAAMVATQNFSGNVSADRDPVDEVDRIIRLSADRH